MVGWAFSSSSTSFLLQTPLAPLVELVPPFSWYIYIYLIGKWEKNVLVAPKGRHSKVHTKYTKCPLATKERNKKIPPLTLGSINLQNLK